MPKSPPYIASAFSEICRKLEESPIRFRLDRDDWHEEIEGATDLFTLRRCRASSPLSERYLTVGPTNTIELNELAGVSDILHYHDPLVVMLFSERDDIELRYGITIPLRAQKQYELEFSRKRLMNLLTMTCAPSITLPLLRNPWKREPIDSVVRYAQLSKGVSPDHIAPAILNQLSALEGYITKRFR